MYLFWDAEVRSKSKYRKYPELMHEIEMIIVIMAAFREQEDSTRADDFKFMIYLWTRASVSNLFVADGKPL